MTESSSFELTTELLLVRAFERGLCLSDFNELTVGMIIGYIVTYNQAYSNDDSQEREATQVDFDAF
ncbi:MAG: hypothetical protein EOL98_15455 [Negativicutes bacterium]|nr:hypothetical protein [Negativicutes bacterium]